MADGSKVGRMAFARICPASQVDELITDSSANPEELDQLRNAGINVTIA